MKKTTILFIILLLITSCNQATRRQTTATNNEIIVEQNCEIQQSEKSETVVEKSEIEIETVCEKNETEETFREIVYQNTATFDEGVIINGIRWATRNVDMPGTFAPYPESPGMLFQWNRRKGWAATGEVTDWDYSFPTGTKWESENDPCPPGWRVPTSAELQKLVDAGSTRITQNDVRGTLFGTAPYQVFLPSVRFRSSGGFLWQLPDDYYWSSTQDNNVFSYALEVLGSYVGVGTNSRTGAFPVRCVAITQKEKPTPPRNPDYITHPHFPNGIAAMRTFFEQNLTPLCTRGQAHAPTARVVLQFTVLTSGEITDIEIVRGIDPAIDRDVLRVARMMPRWIPATYRGEKIEVRYSIPVGFNF
jgi:TonB family protein